MRCEITEESIRYEINGLSVVSGEYEIVNTEDETLVFYTNKMLLQNKIHSHWESWDSFAQLNNGEEPLYNGDFSINKKDIPEIKDNIKVYYTDKSLRKIKSADQAQLKEIIQESTLLAEE